MNLFRIRPIGVVSIQRSGACNTFEHSASNKRLLARSEAKKIDKYLHVPIIIEPALKAR